MIKINLLPFKRKRASTLTKDIRDLILLLVFVGCAFGFYYFMMLRPEIEEQKSNIDSAEANCDHSGLLRVISGFSKTTAIAAVVRDIVLGIVLGT